MTKKAKQRKGLPKGAHRVRIEVKPHGDAWRVTENGRVPRDVPLKLEAVRMACVVARGLASGGGFASVRIHDRKGKFQSERTYPRSSDPCPPKG